MTAPNVNVNFTATGLDNVRRGLTLLKGEAEPTGRQWGHASRQIASGLENIARQGKVTGESLKMIAVQGAEIAFTFGAGGPIVAGLAIVGLAIYEHITGNMKQAQEEAKKAADAIRDMVDAGDKSGIYKQMSAAWRGTPSQGFKDGVTGLTAQRDQIRHDRDVWTPSQGLNVWRKLAADLDTVNGKLAKQQQLFDQLRAAYNAPMPWQGGGSLPGMTTRAGSTATVGSADPLTNRYIVGNGLSPFRFPNEISAIKTQPNAPLMAGLSASGIGSPRPENSQASQAMDDGMKKIGELAGKGFAETLADSIEAGVSRIFQKGANIGTVFAAIADSALSGLGSIAVQIGKQALLTFAFIDKIATAIATLNPAIGIAASIGLIALGSALGGAGHRIGSNASGGGGGGGYGGGYGSSSGYGSAIIDRGIIDPTRGGGVSRSSNNYHFTVIGANDPKAQREIMELVTNAERRGRT